MTVARQPMRRSLGLLASLALVLAMLPMAVASAETPQARGIANACENVGDFDPGFPDIGGFAEPTQDAINCLAFYGITEGFADGTYGPGVDVRRVEMALFLERLLRYVEANTDLELDAPTDQGFGDIGGLSQAAQDAINVLGALGVTEGTTAETFSPSAPPSTIPAAARALMSAARSSVSSTSSKNDSSVS